MQAVYRMIKNTATPRFHFVVTPETFGTTLIHIFHDMKPESVRLKFISHSGLFL